MARTRRSAGAVLAKWIDRIRLEPHGEGRFRLFTERYGCHSGDPRRRWITIAETKGLKAPSAIRRASEGAATNLGLEIVWQDLIPEIASVDWVVAAVIADLTQSDLPPLPAADTLLEQGSAKALARRRVHVEVEWGYDMHSLTVPFAEWIRVASGEDFWTEKRFFYEGGRFTGYWSFCGGKLEVTGDDGAEYWKGNIESVDTLDGPKVDGIDIAHLARAAGVYDSSRPDEEE